MYNFNKINELLKLSNGKCPHCILGDIQIGKYNNTLYIRCTGGCEKSNILSKWGISVKEVYDDYKLNLPIKTYIYRDIIGNEIYTIQRINETIIYPKDIFNGKNMKAIMPYSINLWVNSKTVFIVDNEQTADFLNSNGIPSTTTDIEKWNDYNFNYYFKDKKVIILQRNSYYGYEWSRKAKILLGKIQSSIIDLSLELFFQNGTVQTGENPDDIFKKIGKEKFFNLIKISLNNKEKFKDIEVNHIKTQSDIMNLFDWTAINDMSGVVHYICKTLSESQQSDLHLVLGAFMAAISAMGQRFISYIEVKPSVYNEWFGIFGVHIADSGRNKSGVLDFFRVIIEDYIKSRSSNFEEKGLEQEYDINILKNELKSLEDNAKKKKKMYKLIKQKQFAL